MCGIIGIVSRPSGRRVPTSAEVLAGLDEAIRSAKAGDVALTANRVGGVDQLLRGDSGLAALMDNRRLALDIVSRLEELDAFAANSEAQLEGASSLATAEVERRSLELAQLKDANWAIRNDRLRNATAVFDLAGTGATDAARNAYFSIQQAFAALDRMEVRGRDSAGVHVMVWGHGLEATDSRVAPLLAGRQDDALFTSRSVRVGAPGCAWSFVYKAAAEIGELGDNTRAMRSAVVADDLLRLLVSQPDARVSVLGHTRWASVGIISEPNAHPVNSEELESTFGTPYLVAALNGDVDNHADLKARHGLRFADPITTDAKVIPALVDRLRPAEGSVDGAFRAAVSPFEGSVAVGYCDAAEPGRLLFALSGSGQGCYVGIAEDRFVVASEPYGVVEETSAFVRLDGETPVDPARPTSRGQVAVLHADAAGTVAGITMSAYDGTPIVLDQGAVRTAEVTTRDIDRGDAPHFLLKEITEAPRSFRKTLRGRVAETDGMFVPDLDEATFPARVRERLSSGSIRRIRVIGQGTAAVAGTSLVPVLSELLPHDVNVSALTATELSGFAMEADTALMNRRLEDFIAGMPEQYYWVHKRFKSRPPGEASLYDGVR